MCRVHLLWLRIPHLVMGIRCEGGSPPFHVEYGGGGGGNESVSGGNNKGKDGVDPFIS